MAKKNIAIGDTGGQLVSMFNDNFTECYDNITLLQASSGGGVNVLANGVTGDGITDDTSALQSIITSSATDRETLIIPDGTYLVSATLLIPSYSVIKFTPNAIIKTTADINVIEITGSYIYIEKPSIDVSAAATFTHATIYFGLTQNSTVTIIGPKLTGLNVTNYDVNYQADFTTKNPAGGRAIHIYKPSDSYYAQLIIIRDIYSYRFGAGIELYAPMPASPITPPYPYISGIIMTGMIEYASRAINISNGYIRGCDFDIITETGTNNYSHIVLNGLYNYYRLHPYDVPEVAVMISEGAVGTVVDINGEGTVWIEDYGINTHINQPSSAVKYKEYEKFRKQSFSWGINSTFAIDNTGYSRVIEDDRWCHRLISNGVTSKTFQHSDRCDFISGEAKKVVITMSIKCSHANSVSYTVGLVTISRMLGYGGLVQTSGKYRIVSISGLDITLDNVTGLSEGDYLWVFSDTYQNLITNPTDLPLSVSPPATRRIQIDSISESTITITNTDDVTLADGYVMAKQLMSYEYYINKTVSGTFNTLTQCVFTFDLGASNINRDNVLGYNFQITCSSANTDNKEIFIDSDIQVDIYNDLPKLYDAPIYADNTAALAGGLVAGDTYRTSSGQLMVVFTP